MSFDMSPPPSPSSPSSPYIACLAVIGRQPRNEPLYLRVFGSRQPLDLHYLVHAALDIVDEKIEAPRSKSSADLMYLGALCPVEDYRIYGFVTSTHVKFMLVLQDDSPREADIKSLFDWLHNLYVDTVLGPFCELDAPIQSKRFDQEVGKVVLSFEKIFHDSRTKSPSALQ